MTDLSALGAGTRGVWTREQALRVLTPGQVRERLSSGAWQVVWPGRYADGGGRLDTGQRAVAVTPGRRTAVAAGRTSARWWGFPLIDDDDQVRVVHERRLLLRPHEIVDIGGCAVLSPVLVGAPSSCGRSRSATRAPSHPWRRSAACSSSPSCRGS